jgi:hypothetical protein
MSTWHSKRRIPIRDRFERICRIETLPGVVLDTFNDERRAFEFFVNPLGVQMDVLKDDVSCREDAAWDAIWSSAGRVTATGYVIEMAIPIYSLRFPAGYDL